MKTNRLLTLILTLLLFSWHVNGAESYFASKKESLFTVGTEIFYFDYKEKFTNSILKSEERGVVPGFHVGYSYVSKHIPLFLDLGFSFGSSSVTYDGSLQDGTPHMGTSGLNMSRLELRTGLLFIRSYSNDVGVHVGIQNRSWNRILGKDAQSNLFEENYVSYFMPFGFLWNHTLSGSFRASLDAGVNIPISSQFDVLFPPTFVGNKDAIRLSSPLKTNIGWKIQTPITYGFNSELSTIFSPFLESIQFEDSPVGSVTAAHGTIKISEPSSRTYQYGAQFNFGLHI